MRGLPIAILFGLAAGVATADIAPDHLEFEADQVPLHLLIVPDGSGPPFPGARLEDGSTWDRPFRVRPWVWVWQGPDEPVPIPGYPAEDAWFVSTDGGIGCPGGGNPDGPADAEGWLTWTAPVAGGGSLAGAEVQLYLAGLPFDEILPLTFASPDLSGDDAVDLTDIMLFAAALGSSDPSQADLDGDGDVDLTDIVRFVPAIGAVCP